MSAHARTAHGSANRAAKPVEQNPEPRPDEGEAVYERVDIDRYAVRDGGTVGYVEVVPPVFVCYIGHPYPKAEEVAQTYDFHEAVRAVLAHSGARRRSAR